MDDCRNSVCGFTRICELGDDSRVITGLLRAGIFLSLHLLERSVYTGTEKSLIHAITSRQRWVGVSTLHTLHSQPHTGQVLGVTAMHAYSTSP